MADLFTSGRIVDLVLLMVALEVACLPWLLNRLGSALKAWTLVPNIAAGAALLLALRLSLTDAPWPWIGAAMFSALLAHLYDLQRRLSPGR